MEHFDAAPGLTGSGDVSVRCLLQGGAGSPAAFALLRTDGTSYYAPRRRNNFEELRLALRGDREYAPGRVQPAGGLLYVPEGCYYGPYSERAAPGTVAATLVLQFGGSSGAGYLSPEQLAATLPEMRAAGAFAKRVYTRAEADSERRVVDAYQAAWEHANGSRLRYPRPRYTEPVLVDPDAFRWRSVAGNPVEEKPLGVFTEGRLEVAMLRWRRAGSHAVTGGPAGGVLYPLAGAAEARGVACPLGDAVQLPAGQAVEVAAESGTEAWLVRFPVLPVAHAAGRHMKSAR